MLKKVRFVLLLVLLTHCSKDNTNNPIDDPDPNEGAIPVITISQFEDLVEKKTNFSVSISGTNEQTNTSVQINGKEVVSTGQKNFDVEINPFDYPNGNTTLSVKSVASSNKEGVKDEEFEIKKLLFRSFGGLSTESVESYLAINLQSTGELVAFKKVVTFDDTVFFHADDNFIEEDILVTKYSLFNDGPIQSAIIYGNVKPGTEIMSTWEVANMLGLDLISPQKNASLNLNIEGTSNSGLFQLLGRSYSFGNSSFPTFEFIYDETLTTDLFLFYLNQLDENLLDNYRYAFIDSLTNQTLRFDEMAVLQPDDIFTIDLPQTVKSASISLLGFASEYEYREDMFRLLFNNGITTETAGYSASYPVLEEYPIIVKSINLDFNNGHNVLFNQRGNPDITVPDLSIQDKDSIIQIDGEHDSSSLNLTIKHPDPESNDVFILNYKNLYRDSLQVPFSRLEIPDEIIQFLNEKGFEVDNLDNSGEKELRISKYENNELPNGVFQGYLRREFGDAIWWTFPLQN